ncbi:hypothetical protein LTR91_010179 [Friedmanniomyces endolithicus]|uniref:N-acetyltransferase domain-containing protein n=1 Tax=Friedmanniomyces endolithicus TaxID=329885 RepID=A0A4U0UYG3_9PEZI|nr:hypothetical protein LTS09_001674 [Friedmanniomyces endolithicus]KAK0318299.1 hypothetical protein LTR82_010687 [Friedmanniomyces endolithicus]KAK0927530.1 hypothetical protein LTR57_003251 [Friedmanniomyces endolithicus]KAK0986464.1 hypothetical protein LTR91_010179 [Friedmanniomyces endolithicus]KAK1007993.1 hypothetical protein LTS01_002491 [Friedmanniomyces endolithicus]
MPIHISPLTPPDIPGATTCIQRAFATDPYNTWVFSSPTTPFSPARNAASLALRCTWGITHALFHIARDPSSPSPAQILGVACWLPPRDPAAPRSWHEWRGEWWLWLSQVRMNLWFGRGGLNVQRYYVWKARQAEAQAALWNDPKGYYFCNIVTVLPEAQGRGVGKALFEHVTRRADAEGRRCYLESSRAEPNMVIYEKMGFRLVKEMVCEEGGEAITLYCMMREPRVDG